MNKCIIATTDGKKITVTYDENSYEYSIEDQTIDTSDLVKKISENKTTQKIECDISKYESYIADNDVTDEFKELFKFIKSIIEAYNKAIDDLKDIDI